MSSHSLLEVRVWGERACFTRPEHKVERVSYPVITPSAARGILEAIFWKPEMTWRVHEVWVLKPITYFSLRRNEINTRQNQRSARQWLTSGGGYFADEDRTQRHTLGLRDVHYLIRAEIRLQPHATDNIAKYRDQFRRRVKKGQCFQQPYFGIREYVAYFGPATGTEKPISVTTELGSMLFDQVFSLDKKGNIEFWQHDGSGRKKVRGNVTPRFFSARLEEGRVLIPQALYEGGEPNAS